MAASAINPTLGKALIQPYGSGNDVYVMPPETDVAAPSGGSVSFESDFAGRAYVGSRQTSNPERWTFDLMTRRITISRLRDLARTPQCLNNIILLYGCPEQDWTQFLFGEIYIDAGFAGLSASANVISRTSQADEKVMDSISVSAAIRIEFRPLTHTLSTSQPFTDGAVMAIINLANQRCAGFCGPASDGAQEFIALGNGDAPATVPRIAYTADGGNTWTVSNVAAVVNGTATGVAVIGNNVIISVAGTNGGVYRASLTEVKAGGTVAWTAVTGIAAGVAYNAVKAIGSLVFACGVTGLLWVSRDGGYSFTALASGVATTLSAIAGDDENVVWVGGASGVVLRIRNAQTVGALTIAGIGTDAVTALAVPTNRVNEVYVGTVTGEIHRSRNATDPIPTWSELSFDKPSGGGIIEDMEFSDDMGATFWVVQSNASTTSRVLIDRSGGAMASNAVAIGTYTNPVNALIKAIAPANINYALTAGLVSATNGFMGKIYG